MSISNPHLNIELTTLSHPSDLIRSFGFFMLSVDGEGYKADGKARYVSPDLLADDEVSSGM